MTKTWINTVAAARIMSVSTGTILKLIHSGQIKARRNRGHWPNAGYAVDFESLFDFVQRRKAERKSK